MLASEARIFEEGVLDPAVHLRLVQDLDNIARRAGVPARAIYRRVEGVCHPNELFWLRDIKKYRKRGVAGLVITGEEGHPPEDKMIIMTGVLLRNFIDAKLLTVQQVNEVLADGGTPNATVLLIPNFFVKKEGGGRVAEWEVSKLLGLLLSRFAEEKMSVLYVQDLTDLKKVYGTALYNHIKAHYVIL